MKSKCKCSHFYSEGCVYLEHVDLSYCAVTKEGINALATKCLRLKHILAKYCHEVRMYFVIVLMCNTGIFCHHHDVMFELTLFEMCF